MEDRTDFAAIKDLVDRVRANVQEVIVGKDHVVNLALVALLCRGHLLVEDVPGIGKTTLAKSLAQSLGCVFKRIQFTPDLTPSDITGINYYNQKQGDFQFRPGPIFSQILLADEINRATPRTQSALLEAMQERQVTVDGDTMPLPDPFLVISTQNPIEMEGTFPLPEAQVDRFLLRVRLGYPSKDEEAQILLRFQRDATSPNICPVVDGDALSRAQEAVQEVMIEEVVLDYIVRLARSTREHDGVQLGASPRATMALHKSAQAWAAINGRTYVTPDDVKSMAHPALSHRIILRSQARLRGRSPDDIIANTLSAVPVPIER